MLFSLLLQIVVVPAQLVQQTKNFHSGAEEFGGGAVPLQAPVHYKPPDYIRAKAASSTTPTLRKAASSEELLECTTDKIIIEKLIENYKSFKTPSEQGTTVWIEVWVQEVNAVNEITSDFDMDIYITELWLDTALRYDHLNPCKYNLSLNSEVLDQIWKPNTVFMDSKSAHIHLSPFKNVFLMIYPNGTVWVNYRVQVKGPCSMDFSAFPMDQQSCHLTLYSFSYNNQEVDMRWCNWTQPLSLLKNEIVLPDFVLTNYSTAIKEEVVLLLTEIHHLLLYPAGTWNELTMTFVFSRRYGWYIFQAYIPTYLTIFISWISFCLGPKMIPARTMLGVNSLLALTFQFGNIMRNLPRVSYVKALDVWMLVCLTFVFCSLLELAIIGVLSVREEIKESASSTQLQNGHVCAEHQSRAAINHVPNNNNHTSPKICRNHIRSETPHGFQNYGSIGTDPRMRKKLIISASGSLGREHHEQERRLSEKLALIEGIEIETSFANHKEALVETEFRPAPEPKLGFFESLNSDKVDHLSIIGFPTLFFAFNLIYWPYYLFIV